MSIIFTEQLTQEFQDIVTHVKSRIQDAEQKTNKFNQKVILLGNTGSGKSTIFCGLRKDDLLVKRDKGQTIIVENSQDSDRYIGKGPESKTTCINCFEYSKTTCIVDTPGFQDTGGKKSEESNESNSSQKNIINTLLIKSVLESNYQNVIILVYDFQKFQSSRQNEKDALQFLIKLIPNLDSVKQSIGLVITKTNTEDSEDEIVGDIKNFYDQSNQSQISQLLDFMISSGNIRILSRPLKKHIDQKLDLRYFKIITDLVNKLQGSQFKVNAISQDSCSQLKVSIFINHILQSINDLIAKEIITKFPLFNPNNKTVTNIDFRKQIEDSYLILRNNDVLELVDLNENYTEKIQYITILIQQMKNINMNDDFDKIIENIKIVQMISTLDIELKQIFDGLIIYYDKLVSEYIKTTTQYFQDNEKLHYKLPDQNDENFIHVKRQKVTDKSILEQGFDILLTGGNQLYLDYYYILIKRDNGQYFIQQRIYENEIMYSYFRWIEEFDNQQLVDIQIKILNCLLQIPDLIRGSDLNQIECKWLFQQLEREIGFENAQEIKVLFLEHFKKLNNIRYQNYQQQKTKLEFIALSIFKIVNNILIQLGIKEFLNYGAEKIKLGITDFLIDKGQEMFMNNTDENAILEILKGGNFSNIAMITIITLPFAIIGGIKSLKNTKWRRREYYCEVAQQFSFSFINSLYKKKV